MKNAFLVISLFAIVFFVSGCENKILSEEKSNEIENKLDCKVKEGFEDSMEGDRYIFTFVDGYATQKEVSIEFDTKEEAQAFYDSVSNDLANVLDGKRVYYIENVPEGEKYTREEVKESMERQNCTCN